MNENHVVRNEGVEGGDSVAGRFGWLRYPDAEAFVRADMERYTRETGQVAGVGGWSDYLEWLERADH